MEIISWILAVCLSPAWCRPQTFTTNTFSNFDPSSQTFTAGTSTNLHQNGGVRKTAGSRRPLSRRISEWRYQGQEVQINQVKEMKERLGKDTPSVLGGLCNPKWQVQCGQDMP